MRKTARGTPVTDKKRGGAVYGMTATADAAASVADADAVEDARGTIGVSAICYGQSRYID